MNILLSSIVKEEDIIYMANAAKYCSLKLGGNFEYLVLPKSIDDFICYIINLQHSNINFKVLGNMTNIVPRDGIIKGVFISTKQIQSGIRVFQNRIIADCGTMLAAVCVSAKEHSLSGMEGLFGIPATVGGAIYNNAGAFGTEISNILESVLICKNGKIKSVDAKDIKFDYRFSQFQQDKSIILSATFLLSDGNKQDIWQKMQENMQKRKNSQPGLPSAGSVFKKYNNISAGYYIDRAGLKGLSCGDAKISNIHANFIVNNVEATFKDFDYLASIIEQKVYEKFGILLQKEVEYLGENDESTSRLSHT